MVRYPSFVERCGAGPRNRAGGNCSVAFDVEGEAGKSFYQNDDMTICGMIRATSAGRRRTIMNIDATVLDYLHVIQTE